jgi:ribosome-associated toxin RatA of RatAB toxin-antitoxin module
VYLRAVVEVCMKVMWRSVVLSCFLLAVWSPGTWAFSSGADLDLSADQASRLDRGEIVLLDTLPPGGPDGGGNGGTAVARVQASPEAVWKLLTGYSDHVGLYPHVIRVQVLETNPVHALVRYVVGVGPFSFGFHVDNFPDETRHRIDYHLDRQRSNGLFRYCWGYWQVEPDGEGTVLIYGLGGRTYLPAFLTRGAERDGLLQTVEAVRSRAERVDRAHVEQEQ